MQHKVTLALLVCAVVLAQASASALSTGLFSILSKDHGGYTADDSSRKLMGASSTAGADASCHCGSKRYTGRSSCYCWCGKRRRSLFGADSTNAITAADAADGVTGGQSNQATTSSNAAMRCDCNGYVYRGSGCYCYHPCRG